MTIKKIQLHNALDDTRKILQRLVGAVRYVRSLRQMNAAEPPEVQDAWDDLMLAVLEAERLDKPREKENTAPHLPKRMAHGSRARKAGRG